MRIFFYAFANSSFLFNEVIKLSKSKKQEIDWGIIYPRVNNKNSSTDIVDIDNIFYLYEDFDLEYKNFKDKDIDFFNSFDNIYRIIESSKFGYKKEDSEKQLKNAYIIYKLYKEFLIKSRPDYVIFPDLEVVNGLILFHLCRELHIETMCTVHLRILGKRSFFSRDYRDTLPLYYGDTDRESLELSKKMLDDFVVKKFKTASMSKAVQSEDRVSIDVPNIFIRFIKSFLIKFKYENKIIKDDNVLLRIIMNFPSINSYLRELYYNIFQKKYFQIKRGSDDLPEKFILLALQVTPESSINTFEQYFIDQDRMIDFIRLNMPSDFYILAKEHIGARGKRKTSWYKKMRKKPGLLLVEPEFDTTVLIDKSKLITTITGTIALESYLKDKNVLMFSQTFFSHLVNRIESFSSFKNELNKILNNEKFDNEQVKLEEIAKLYNISYDFFVHEPFHFEKVMTRENISNFLNAINSHISKLE